MNAQTRILVAVAFLAVSAACGGSSSNGGGGGTAIEAALQGSWASPCQSGGSFSEKSFVTISGNSASSTLYDYSNGTCSGSGTLFDSSTATFTIGSTVTVPLGAASVTAYQVDSAVGGVTFYDLVYVDGGVTPNRLYSGDSSGANDGSTPAKRPTALDASFYMLRQ